jgi:flagellin
MHGSGAREEAQMVAISSNFTPYDGLRNLQRAQAQADQSILRLSSGEKLIKASDGPADMVFSRNLRSEIEAMSSLKRNHFDSLGFIDVASDQIEQAILSLERIVELSEYAASGTSGSDFSDAKLALDLEYQELLQEIDQLNDELRYNDLTVFGSAGVTFDVNLVTDVVNSSIDQVAISTSTFSIDRLNLSGTDITTSVNASAVLAIAMSAIEFLSRQQGRLGTEGIRLQMNLEDLDNRILDAENEETGLREVDIADETVRLTKAQILSESATAVLAQANLDPARVFSLLG